MNTFYTLIILVFVTVSCGDVSKDHKTEEASFFSEINFFSSENLKIDSTIIHSLKNEDVKNFYIKNKYEVAWTSEKNRNDLLNELKISKNEGLEPHFYNYATLKKYESKFDDLNDSTLIIYDLLLTQNAQL